MIADHPESERSSRNNACNTSTLIGAIQMTISGSAAAIISVLHNGTVVPMAGDLLCCCGFSCLYNWEKAAQ